MAKVPMKLFMEMKMKKDKKFVVTGGCGFIGSHIVNKLADLGHKVVVIDNLYSGFESYIPDSSLVTFLNVDISDWDSLSRNFSYFHNVNGVFHLAAIARIQPSIFNPWLTHQYNVQGTFNILEMMRMCNISSIVYSASSSYYGKREDVPFNEDDLPSCETPYAITKYMGEMYCKTWGRLYNIRNVSLRYFNVYGKRSPLVGPYAPVIGLFFRQAIEENSITVVGDGEQRRDFTHIGDVVSANIIAMNKLTSPDWEGVTNSTFNIGTGKNYSINEIVKIIEGCLGGSGIFIKAKNIPPRVGEAQVTLANIHRAEHILEWEPLASLESGILDLKTYYLNNVQRIKSGDLSL